MRATLDGMSADVDYIKATPEQRASVCNGLGPASLKLFGFKMPNWVKNIMFPDTIYGLNVNPAANIHDWDYEYMPKNEESRRVADAHFYENVLVLIERARKNSPFFLTWLRKQRARFYYSMLKRYGKAAFYDKNMFHESK